MSSRVTTRAAYNLAMREMTIARGQWYDTQEKLITGRKINRPSDDPAGNAQAVRLRSSIDKNETYQNNASRGKNWLLQADTALQSMSSIVARGREIAVQMANGTRNAEERQYVANEVDGLLEFAVQLANSKVDDEYIFGGNQTIIAPFDAAGNYTGDNAIRLVETGDGVQTPIAIRGGDAFAGTSGGENVFQILTDLATALRANDETGIRDAAGDLGDMHDQLGLYIVDTGAKLSRVEKAATHLEELYERFMTNLSDVEDADMFETASNLTLQEAMIEKLASATARILTPSVMDYMR